MRTFSIEELKKNSGLPGPRGNLTLLHEFITQCDAGMVTKCLSELKADTTNSPEEFVGMCGVVGYAMLNWKNTNALVRHLLKYAVHQSWRIREAVAIALQEIPVGTLEARLALTQRMESDDPLVNRAIVAGLCEPKNLKQQTGLDKVFAQLWRSTMLLKKSDKLSDGDESLRKALGYCWSVAIVESPKAGKSEFARLLSVKNKHIAWIVRENLKKNRLVKLDEAWVERMFQST